MKMSKVKSYSKKIISLSLIVIMLVSVFASSALTGYAAELEPSAESGYTVYRSKNYLFGIKGSTTVSTFKKMFSGLLKVASEAKVSCVSRDRLGFVISIAELQKAFHFVCVVVFLFP